MAHAHIKTHTHSTLIGIFSTGNYCPIDGISFIFLVYATHCLQANVDWTGEKKRSWKCLVLSPVHFSQLHVLSGIEGGWEKNWEVNWIWFQVKSMKAIPLMSFVLNTEQWTYSVMSGNCIAPIRAHAFMSRWYCNLGNDFSLLHTFLVNHGNCSIAVQ